MRASLGPTTLRGRETLLELLFRGARELADAGEPVQSLELFTELLQATERPGPADVRALFRARACIGAARCHLDLEQPAAACALIDEVPLELRSNPDLLGEFASAHGAALGGIGDLEGMCHQLGRAIAVFGLLHPDARRLQQVLELLLGTLRRRSAWSQLQERCDRLEALPGLEPKALALIRAHRSLALQQLHR